MQQKYVDYLFKKLSLHNMKKKIVYIKFCTVRFRDHKHKTSVSRGEGRGGGSTKIKMFPDGGGGGGVKSTSGHPNSTFLVLRKNPKKYGQVIFVHSPHFVVIHFERN